MSTVTTLGVTGMTCGNCVSHVTTELEAVTGVENVTVKLDSEGTSQVTVFSDNPLDEAALREAVDEAGYDIATITVRQDAQATEASSHADEIRAAHASDSGETTATLAAAEVAARVEAEEPAGGCGCGGCGCGGGGAGPSYSADQGTYTLSVPPQN